jgi:hypothetical protein
METRETIALDARAQQRLVVLTHVLAGEVRAEEAAAYLRLSVRHVLRLVGRLRTEGAAALVHGNRGRPPVNRLDEHRRARIAALATGELAGFNGVHIADVLAEEVPELAVSAKTVLRILDARGVARIRTRRARGHRTRRERMPRAGMLLQVDGSRHDWLEGRGPVLSLVAGIDDATGRFTAATFRAQEDAAGYLALLAMTSRAVGLPLAVYSDRHGVFVKDPDRPATLAEQLTGRRALTQVGRALEESGTGWIAAGSPEAKGRVERGFGTLQDRLVSELRRARASTLEEADVVLGRYLPRHNDRFGVPAAVEDPAWRPWSSPWPIGSVFSLHYRRRVSSDDTLEWEGRALAVPRATGGGVGRRWVLLEEHLDGSLWARDGSAHVPLAPAPESAPLLRARGLARDLPPGVDAPGVELEPTDPADRPPSAASTRRPGSDHPWRAGYDRRRTRTR